MSEKTVPSIKNSPLPRPLRYGLYAAICLYAAAWSVRLYMGTRDLIGFFGDGAITFIMQLSHSYVFGRPGHLIHLFRMPLPRDCQLLLDAVGLQIALWLGIRDPDIFKYTFTFWQLALPGFLYLTLFGFLWRKGHASWIVFPLVSWAILSVPVDWAPTASSRVALPIFWMHFMLVILSGPKIRPWPAAAAVVLGIAILGGLYESVVLECALCLGLGVLMWRYRNNRVPFLYGLAAVPAACRAVFSYISFGHNEPNSFHALVLPAMVRYNDYFFFIAAALALVAVLASGKIPARYAVVAPLLLILPAFNLFTGAAPGIWQQMDMRFDYAILSLAPMIWAGFLRLRGVAEVGFAPSVALVCLLAGTVLWVAQIQGASQWASCRAGYSEQMRGTTLGIDQSLRGLFAAADKTGRPVAVLPYRECIWDWSEPWARLLLSDNGRVESWPVTTFWQEFSFVKKDGAVYLHTDGWGPAMQNAVDLPLQTLLYDLTPLYQKLGDGPLAVRTRCMKPEEANSYWRTNLMDADDSKRIGMFVCPRYP